jgi:hypothetical protein
MSKEYPLDRKLQKAEDQERMSRILKRRAGDEPDSKKANTSETTAEKADQFHDKARSASSND